MGPNRSGWLSEMPSSSPTFFSRKPAAERRPILLGAFKVTDD